MTTKQLITSLQRVARPKPDAQLRDTVQQLIRAAQPSFNETCPRILWATPWLAWLHETALVCCISMCAIAVPLLLCVLLSCFGTLPTSQRTQSNHGVRDVCGIFAVRFPQTYPWRNAPGLSIDATQQN